MKANNKHQALIDKVCIYGIHVKDVEDVEGLIERGIIDRKDKQKHYCITPNGEFYSSITIKNDKLFDSFTYSISSSGREWGRLHISINDETYGNLNCYTADEYRDRIKEIKQRLKSEYGISVNFAHAKYDYIEINKTISLNHEYKEYERPLNLLMGMLPRKLRLKYINSPSQYITDKKFDLIKQTGTLNASSGKKGMEICIYNKSEQLKKAKKIHTDKNYLRYEIKLKSSSKIKNKIGTNNVWQLNDNQINAYFSRHIKECILDPYDKYQHERNRSISQILKEYYIPGSRTWTRDVMYKLCRLEIKKQLPLMLDIDELLPMLDSLRFSSRQVKHHCKNRFLELATDSPDIFVGDSAKFAEILQKLSS